MTEMLYVVFKLCHVLVAFSLCFGTVLFIAAMLLVPTVEHISYIVLSLLFLVVWAYLSHKVEEMLHVDRGN